MAGKVFTVKARFVADTGQASANVGKYEGRFKRLTKTIKSSAVAQIAALGGVVVALRGLTRFIGSSIEKANQQEVAVNQLNAALSTLGPTADAVSKSLQEQAAALQKVTTFGDETIIEVQTMIASFVKNEEQIKAATKATLDFSVAFGIDLKGAAALVAKSLGSSTNALTRYGIEVTGAVGSTERITTLVDNLGKVAGGRAQAAINTFAGAIDQLKNSIGDAQEKLASFITQNDKMVKSINALSVGIPDFVVGVGLIGQSIDTLDKKVSIFGGLIEKITSLIGAAVGGYAILFKAVSIFGGTEEKLNDILKQSAFAHELIVKRQKARLGITDDLNDATKTAAQLTLEAAEAAKTLAEEEKRLAEILADGTTALGELSAALGETTSVKLQAEILKIEENLLAVRDAGVLGAAEFERYSDLSRAKIGSLELRIRSLRDGMGDLAATTRSDLVPSVAELGAGFNTAGKGADTQRKAIVNLRRESDLLIATNGRLAEGYVVLVARENELTQAQQRRLNLASKPGLLDRSRRESGGLIGGRITNFNIPGGTFVITRPAEVDQFGNIINR